MKESLKIFAPGSVSNVGSGYDIMGFSFEGPGDIIEISLNRSGAINISNRSSIDIPTDSSNVIFPAIEAMIRESKTSIGVDINILQKILPGSGIGSSAASSVAAVFGLNQLIGEPFSRRDLISFAMEGEKLVSGEAHADNVAPCLLGGFTLIRSYNPLDIIEIPYPKDLICTVIHPEISIKTFDSRSILKSNVLRGDMVTQVANAASLVAGLIMEDLDLIGRSVVDVFAEPSRMKLIPGYQAAKRAAMECGAIAFNISGSGPSVFAFSTSVKNAEKIGEQVKSVFLSEGIRNSVYISRISQTGVRVVT